MSYFVKWLHCAQGKNEPSLSAIYAPPFFHFKKKEMSQWNYKGKNPVNIPFSITLVFRKVVFCLEYCSDLQFEKLFLWYEKNLWKFEVVGREFSSILRLLEQWNVRTFFEKRILGLENMYFFYLLLEISTDQIHWNN